MQVDDNAFLLLGMCAFTSLVLGLGFSARTRFVCFLLESLNVIFPARQCARLILVFAVRRDFPITFGTMHFSGLLGMPRRIYTYDADRGWALLNQVTTLGAIIQVPSFVLFVWNVFASLRNGRPAGADPWDAWTLEWATPSPPPAYNFAVIPTVHSRRPLWDLKHPDDPDWQYD